MSLQAKRKLALVPILVLVLIIAEAGFGGLYFKKYNDLKSASSKTVEQKNKELVTKVGKVYQLPTGEDPVVLVVKSADPKDFTSDLEKGIAQAFKDIKKDDVFVLYEKAAIAIQFRPSENKVITTVPLSIKSGTNVALIASADSQVTLTDLLTKKLPNDVRIGGKSTPVGQYTSTTVVDISGKKADIAKKVADAVGGTIATTLPAGEKIPDGAEIVVIAASAVAPVVTPTL